MAPLLKRPTFAMANRTMILEPELDEGLKTDGPAADSDEQARGAQQVDSPDASARRTKRGQMEGLLASRGDGIVGRWETLYYRLDSGALKAYPDKAYPQDRPLTVLGCQHLRDLVFNDATLEFSFEAKGAKLRLRAGTQKELQHWQRALGEASQEASIKADAKEVPRALSRGPLAQAPTLAQVAKSDAVKGGARLQRSGTEAAARLYAQRSALDARREHLKLRSRREEEQKLNATRLRPPAASAAVDPSEITRRLFDDDIAKRSRRQEEVESHLRQEVSSIGRMPGSNPARTASPDFHEKLYSHHGERLEKLKKERDQREQQMEDEHRKNMIGTAEWRRAQNRSEMDGAALQENFDRLHQQHAEIEKRRQKELDRKKKAEEEEHQSMDFMPKTNHKQGVNGARSSCFVYENLGKPLALRESALAGTDEADGSEEFRTFATMLLQKFPTAEQAFKGLDISGEGVLTRNEFEIAARGIRWGGDTKAVFREMDVNRNGVLTAQEFARLARLPRAEESLVEKFRLKTSKESAAKTEGPQRARDPALAAVLSAVELRTQGLAAPAADTGALGDLLKQAASAYAPAYAAFKAPPASIARRSIQEHLVPEADAFKSMYELDPIRQVDSDLELLLAQAELAQERLMEAVLSLPAGSGADWPAGEAYSKPALFPMALFAHNPGVKAQAAAEVKAYVLYGPTDGAQAGQHVLDLARLSVVFASWDLLESGVQRAMEHLDVLQVRCHGRSQVHDCYVEVLVAVDLEEYGVPFVCELRFDVIGYWKARQTAEPYWQQFYDALLDQLALFPGTDPDAVAYLAKHVLHSACASQNLRHLRRGLAQKYGSTVNAWRQLCSEGTLGFKCFRQVCQLLNRGPHAAEYWAELDAGCAGHVGLFELDPEAVCLLIKFRERALALTGCEATGRLDATALTRALCDMTKVHEKGRLRLFEFRQVSKFLGLTEAEGERVFSYLDRQGCKDPATIGAQDLALLNKLPGLVNLHAAALGALGPGGGVPARCSSPARPSEDALRGYDSADDGSSRRRLPPGHAEHPAKVLGPRRPLDTPTTPDGRQREAQAATGGLARGASAGARARSASPPRARSLGPPQSWSEAPAPLRSPFAAPAESAARPGALTRARTANFPARPEGPAALSRHSAAPELQPRLRHAKSQASAGPRPRAPAPPRRSDAAAQGPARPEARGSGASAASSPPGTPAAEAAALPARRGSAEPPASQRAAAAAGARAAVPAVGFVSGEAGLAAALSLQALQAVAGDAPEEPAGGPPESARSDGAPAGAPPPPEQPEAEASPGERPEADAAEASRSASPGGSAAKRALLKGLRSGKVASILDAAEAEAEEAPPSSSRSQRLPQYALAAGSKTVEHLKDQLDDDAESESEPDETKDDQPFDGDDLEAF